MSGRRGRIDDWRRAVYASRHISDSTRVLLLFLADNMRESDLKVSVNRKVIAKALNRSERRINDRFREAVGEAEGQDPTLRLLDRVVRGTKHSQAVYQGLMPDVVNRTHGGPVETQGQQDGFQHVENARNRPVENHDLSVNPHGQQDTRGSCLTRAEPPRWVENRNGAEDEDPPESAASLRPCAWHPSEACPPDCPTAEPERRASA